MDAFPESWKYELPTPTVVRELNSASSESGAHELLLSVRHLNYKQETLELPPVMTQLNLEWGESCALSLGVLSPGAASK